MKLDEKHFWSVYTELVEVRWLDTALDCLFQDIALRGGG